MIPVGILGLMSISILVTRYFPRFAARVASWAPACFFVFATHYFIIILIRESQIIGVKGWVWDVLWLCLIPVIYGLLASLFFSICRFAPKWVPLLGAYRVK